MPNWCYTQVCFKGKPENIKRLARDVELADEFNHKYGHTWCNIRYFLLLNNFDTVSYLQRYDNPLLSPTFRGYIYGNRCVLEDHEDYALYYPTFDMAWNMDYHVLEVISKIYDVVYSAYSCEPGMDIRTKCRNGDIDNYNFDFSIVPDYDDYESALDQNPELDLDYDNPVKAGSEDIVRILKEMKDNNIICDVRAIDEDIPPDIYGVYYHFINGVEYDDEEINKWRKYPTE